MHEKIKNNNGRNNIIRINLKKGIDPIGIKEKINAMDEEQK